MHDPQFKVLLQGWPSRGPDVQVFTQVAPVPYVLMHGVPDAHEVMLHGTVDGHTQGPLKG